jgi:hypothetical protein
MKRKSTHQSYLTKHSTIKEVSIGDQFILNNGIVVECDSISKKYVKGYIFRMRVIPFENGKIMLGLSTILYYQNLQTTDEEFFIKSRYIRLKDKVELL